MRIRWLIMAVVIAANGCKRETTRVDGSAPVEPGKSPEPAKAMPKPVDIGGRIGKHKVGDQEVELRFTTVNASGVLNLDDSNRMNSVEFGGLMTIPAAAPVLGVGALEATEASDEKGTDLVAPSKPVPPPTPPGGTAPTPTPPSRFYGPLEKPRPGEKDIMRGVAVRLAQLKDVPKTIMRLKGSLFLLLKVKSEQKEVPVSEMKEPVEIAKGYSVQITKIENRANTITLQAKLKRPNDDPMNYQGHRFRIVGLDDKGEPVPGGASEAAVTKESQATWFFALPPQRKLEKLQITVNTEMKEQALDFDLRGIPVL